MPEIKKNKKAHLMFDLVDTFEAGLVLTGAEVKSAKAGFINMEGSFIKIDNNNQVWIRGLKISPYPKAGRSQSNFQADRHKRLLLHKREILQLKGKIGNAGLTIIPLSVYTSHSLVKIKIAVVKGKNKYDKRQAIKEREFKRRLNSRVKN